MARALPRRHGPFSRCAGGILPGSLGRLGHRIRQGWSGAIDALTWKKGDLLIFGSTPPGPRERVFVGSTATEFLRHVHVPVLLTPLTPVLTRRLR
ncbi:universal stress protein [Corynebacterium lemuris]|uniref:universal stress protein n=1 Tax=Corynebacterium lemuris TaxID=1859292 RepID=UPI0034E1F65A